MSLDHDSEDKTFDIFNMSDIESALTHRVVTFDFKVQYYNRQSIMLESNSTNIRYVSFETLLRISDVISVHLSLFNAIRHLIELKEFAMMKDEIMIVNTTRNSIIDEQALVNAMKREKIFEAKLNVYEMKSKIHSKLLNSEKIVLLPHIEITTFQTQICRICFIFN
jgi:glyoxylate reductase